jgi:pimeloyl-ACP methyl ester carboxylesterase
MADSNETAKRHQILSQDGLRLNLLEWGDGERVLVALHGIRGYADTFARLAADRPAGWRVVALDQRGRGDSDWDPGHNYYTDAYLTDLEAVLAWLGPQRVSLLGHSMGGITALAFAAAQPERLKALVIEDAGPGAFEESPGARRIQAELRAAPARFADRQAAEAYMQALRPTVTPETISARVSRMTKSLPEGGLTWRHDHGGITATRLAPDPARLVDLWPCVRALACPTLLLRGGRSDYLLPAFGEAMAAANPRIRHVAIDGAGHYVHDDQPEVFSRDVWAFLSAVG